MTTHLSIEKTINLIQEVRLIHAIAESSHPLSIPEVERAKFSRLEEKFGPLFNGVAAGSFDLVGHTKIVHRTPETGIGDLSRPLIFPRAIVEYCRSLWGDKREIRYLFQGLVTSNRHALINTWIERNIPGTRKRVSPEDGLFSRLQKKVYARVGFVYSRKKVVGDLILCSSNRGRVFPVKGWDEEYFQTLASAQFVLCPSGDYIWSYRFFESVLCGAIPIVEEDCAAYEGFQFSRFSDDAATLSWSRDIAEHNFQVCVDRLTLPKDILDRELGKIIKGGDLDD